MEVAGLRSPLNEATDYSAYVERMEELGEPYDYDNDNLRKIIKKYAEKNESTFKQAAASQLSNSKISGELAVSKDEFANAIAYNTFFMYTPPGGSAIYAWVSRYNSQQYGRKTAEQLAQAFSSPGLKGLDNRSEIGTSAGMMDPFKQPWYNYADASSEVYNKKVPSHRKLNRDLEWTVETLKGDVKSAKYGIDDYNLLCLYVINSQGGSEASTWKLDDETSWVSDFKKLMDAKGDQAAAELLKAYEAVFDAWVELAMSDDFAKHLAKTPPKGKQKSVSIDGKQAAKELKKDATLKGEFEKWLVDTLEMGGATREDLIADYGDGMNLDPMDLDMDDIVSNIINNKKYSDDLGEFFSEYKNSLNESIFEQLTKVKKQLWK